MPRPLHQQYGGYSDSIESADIRFACDHGKTADADAKVFASYIKDGIDFQYDFPFERPANNTIKNYILSKNEPSATPTQSVEKPKVKSVTGAYQDKSQWLSAMQKVDNGWISKRYARNLMTYVGEHKDDFDLCTIRSACKDLNDVFASLTTSPGNVVNQAYTHLLLGFCREKI